MKAKTVVSFHYSSEITKKEKKSPFKIKYLFGSKQVRSEEEGSLTYFAHNSHP
jgi:hypothetical protein